LPLDPLQALSGLTVCPRVAGAAGLLPAVPLWIHAKRNQGMDDDSVSLPAEFMTACHVLGYPRFEPNWRALKRANRFPICAGPFRD